MFVSALGLASRRVVATRARSSRSSRLPSSDFAAAQVEVGNGLGSSSELDRCRFFVGLVDAEVDDQAVVHQRVGAVAKLRLLAPALACHRPGYLIAASSAELIAPSSPELIALSSAELIARSCTREQP